MPKRRIIKPQQAQYLQARDALFEQINKGELSLGDAVKGMREVLGMTQTEFGEKIANISRKAVSQIENGQGDPKLSTLNSCCQAFGMEVGFIIKNQ
ncbi:MAG: hypothetical protein COA42_05035 [Alteromonadaceae bacterium]|nr:MAG: hypothetical protein COA42_05035 [Alteromonadaceae bacterium]